MADCEKERGEDYQVVRGGSVLKKLIFMVESAPEGGYTARALGASIFAEADNLEESCDVRFAMQLGVTLKKVRALE